MIEETTEFDPVEMLDSEGAVAKFMLVAYEIGGAAFIAETISVAARARLLNATPKTNDPWVL